MSDAANSTDSNNKSARQMCVISLYATPIEIVVYRKLISSGTCELN